MSSSRAKRTKLENSGDAVGSHFEQIVSLLNDAQSLDNTAYFKLLTDLSDHLAKRKADAAVILCTEKFLKVYEKPNKKNLLDVLNNFVYTQIRDIGRSDVN